MMHVEQLKTEVEDSLQKLRMLRDQIRLEAHLATMEARTQWEQLEKRIEVAERKFTRDLSQTSRRTVDELLKATTEFRSSLRLG